MESVEEGKNCVGWAARDTTGVLSPYNFKRRAVGVDDVSVKIAYCGICYGDIVYTKNIQGIGSKYPLVPGHEIVGIVEQVGANVNRFKAGDHVGVGTYVNSCRDCEDCDRRREIQCLNGLVKTYSSVDVDGTLTQGGYSKFIVVHHRYCFRIPENYPLAPAAPLLCAGITVYAPMIRHKMNQPGKSLGVVGLGGLGHLAVKFGKAFGLHVTVICPRNFRKDDALNLLGVNRFLLSTDEQQMKDSARTLDFIIDTVSRGFEQYMPLLKTSGILTMVAFPGEVKFNPVSLLGGTRSIEGSYSGGTQDTQEMLDFCAANKIYPQVEIIPIEYANEAFERHIKGDVKFRFVIDIENSLK